MSPNAGGGGNCGVSAQPMSTAIHRSPNKLWRSNSIWATPVPHLPFLGECRHLWKFPIWIYSHEDYHLVLISKTPLPKSPHNGEICLLYTYSYIRGYWAIYRGPGFLAVEWLGSSSTPPPPLPSANYLYFSVFLCVAGWAYWRRWGGGEGGGRGAKNTPARQPGPLKIIHYIHIYASKGGAQHFCRWINLRINFKTQGFQDSKFWIFCCLFQADNMKIRKYWACAKFFDDSPEKSLRFLDVLDTGLQDTGETAPDRQLAALWPALWVHRRLAVIRGSICRARSALMARGSCLLLCVLLFRGVPCKRKIPFWHLWQ